MIIKTINDNMKKKRIRNLRKRGKKKRRGRREILKWKKGGDGDANFFPVNTIGPAKAGADTICWKITGVRPAFTSGIGPVTSIFGKRLNITVVCFC